MRKNRKKAKKSVDKGMNAWYNNKAVGRDWKTKGLERQQIVSWKLNNALNKTLEDSKSKIEELIKKSSRRRKKTAS